MTAAAFPGDGKARTAADLTDEQAVALGRVVSHMTADEEMTVMARIHVIPMGEVPPDADMPALVRMSVEQEAREHTAWIELLRWRREERVLDVDSPQWHDAIGRLRDVADRIGLASS